MASSPGCRAMRTWCSSGIGNKECRAARISVPLVLQRCSAAAPTLLRTHRTFIGGYEVLQTGVLVVSLPILAIGVLMSVALVKQLGADRVQAQP